MCACMSSPLWFSHCACQCCATLAETMLGIFLSASVYLLMAMLVRVRLPPCVLVLSESEVLHFLVFIFIFSPLHDTSGVNICRPLHPKMTAPLADPGSVGSLTSGESRMRSSCSALSVLFRVEDERPVSLKWKFKSSLKEHLPDAAVSDNKLWQATSCAAWQPKTVPGSKNANRAH